MYISNALYIKWRPKFFSEIVDQDDIINSIKNSFIMSKLHHAYLISGSYGIGKTTIARLIAKGLNCIERKNFNCNFPCGKCKSCNLIENNNFLDFIEIDAASKTKIDDIRDLLEKLQYPSYNKFNKICLIDEVHMLSKQSFGTLLKSLEEPPNNITFILVTTDIKKIPNTILSRCICLYLKNIKVKSIVNRLILISKSEKVNFELDALYIIANLSKGSMRDAINLLEQSIVIGKNNINCTIVNSLLGDCNLDDLIDIIKFILINDYNNLFIKLNYIFSLNLNYELIIDKILIILHCIYMIKFNKNYIFNFSFLIIKSKILYLSRIISLYKINMLSNNFLNLKKNLDYYPNNRIGFEISILQIIYILNK